MSHYIDVDALLTSLPDDLPYKASVKRVLMQAPTVDIDRSETSFQEDLEFFVNDCTEAQLKALYERVGEKIKEYEWASIKLKLFKEKL